MKLIELINIYRTLDELAARPLPAKLAYGITQNIKIMMPYIQSFEVARQKAIESGDIDGLNELLNEEVEEGWYKVSYKHLPEEIEVKYVVALDFMLENED